MTVGMRVKVGGVGMMMVGDGMRWVAGTRMAKVVVAGGAVALEDVVEPEAAHGDALGVLVGALAMLGDTALTGVQGRGPLVGGLLLQLQVAVQELLQRLHELLVVLREVQHQRLVLGRVRHHVRQPTHCRCSRGHWHKRCGLWCRRC